MLCEIAPRKLIKSKIKQLFCGAGFSAYANMGVPKSLVSVQVLAAKQIKRDISERIE